MIQQKKSRLHEQLSLLLICCLAGFLGTCVWQQLLPQTLIWIYLLMSCITFIAYAIDKSSARKGEWRTSENTLQLLSFMGGWPGALLAQKWLRHKSQKHSFRLTLWMMILANCTILIWLISTIGQSWLLQSRLM
ncbi:DUF1294 domain-containing protein [Shewanella sp. VB17]|nr:DUF1294 domain-containing protein [Shewanella sp. VB17]